jgi:hypothetical protein
LSFVGQVRLNLRENVPQCRRRGDGVFVEICDDNQFTKRDAETSIDQTNREVTGSSAALAAQQRQQRQEEQLSRKHRTAYARCDEGHTHTVLAVQLESRF